MARQKRIEDATDLDEALRLSNTEGAALPQEDEDDDEDYLPDEPGYGDEDDEDPDIAGLNDPDVETFEDPPQLGTRAQTSDLFGSTAQTFGRASSPKLYAQAANFPTAVQYRVWRWENGIPVALGAISAEATEEDMVRQFYDAMPKPGDGRFQFRFRPVDIRGKELNKEFTLNFSEHHAEVARIRRRKTEEREERGVSDPILINQGGADTGAYEEMGRMFEQAVEASDRRTDVLQQTLEEERARLREEEKSRYQERIQIADRSATVVQQMTDKLMQTDRARSEEQVKGQREQSQLLLSTLTTVFQQQQDAARGQSERMRESDNSRMQQDREFFDRARQQAEDKRQADSQEWDRKRTQEREEASAKRIQERTEAEHRILSERDRLGLEGKRIEEQRKFELEQMRMESDKRERQMEARREREREESRAKLEREKLEMDRQRESAREDRERWRAELEDKRSSERAEADRKRQQEREEWERKRQQEKDDAERRERAERERMERERQDFQLRMERERQEAERRDVQRQSELSREGERRREEMVLQQKQMDLQSQQAREYAERQARMASEEREAQRAHQLHQAQAERESRELADKQRERQHAMQMKQMDIERTQAREHQERLGQLERAKSVGGLGGLVETLGMETPELLARIFGGGEGDGDSGSWSDAIPKVLGSIAELGKAAMVAKQEGGPQVHGRRRVAATAPAPAGQIVQTPQGPMVLMPRAPGIPVGVPRQAHLDPDFSDLPMDAAIPEEFQDEDFEVEGLEEDLAPESSEEQVPEPEEEEIHSAPVDTLARAKAAAISLRDQKKARKAVRALTEKLSRTVEDEWLGLITEAITSEVGIYYYIKAVTVEAALGESGAPSELAARIVSAMQESALIPEDVPYTEADYAAATAGEEE